MDHVTALRRLTTDGYLGAIAQLEEEREPGGPASVSQIAARLGVTYQVASDKLRTMELDATIRATVDGRYERILSSWE